jgi:hypothetical protein
LAVVHEEQGNSQQENNHSGSCGKHRALPDRRRRRTPGTGFDTRENPEPSLLQFWTNRQVLPTTTANLEVLFEEIPIEIRKIVRQIAIDQ